MPKRLDPPAFLQRFGRLRVVVPDIRHKGRHSSICLCDCGNSKTVRVSELYNGNVASCGCLLKDTIHGMCKAPEYGIWMALKQRCSNPNNSRFDAYKDRGVCQRWQKSFEAFYQDMGPRPTSKHSIDRINNDGPYSPENCRWALPSQQARNKSNNINLTYQGKTQCLTDWARELNISRLALRSRIQVLGWSVERALTTPVRKAKGA